jgi:hypothetical protein
MVPWDSDDASSQVKVLDLERKSDFSQKNFAHHFKDVLLDNFHELFLVLNLIGKLRENFSQNVTIFEANHIFECS